MQKSMNMNRLVVAVGLVGSMGLAANSALAADFGVTTDVQNTLAVTVVDPLNLGTLFAVTASDGATESLTLSPTGDYSTGPLNNADITLLSLGGQVPARGSVATDQSFNVIVPHPDPTSLIDGGVHSTTGVVEVRIQGGDPDVARFYLGNFTVGDAVGGTLGTPVDDTGAATRTVPVEPDFGVTEVTFAIGADVFTDTGATTTSRNSYEEGIYEGTVAVTAEF